jgi:hypothetical protein
MGKLSADNLKGVDPATLLDALYQQGYSMDQLRGLAGLRVGEITSRLIKSGADVGSLGRAVDVVKGADKTDGSDYENLVSALKNRDLDPAQLGYKGGKDANSLVAWLSQQAGKGTAESKALIERKLDAAVVSVMPTTKLVGGRSYADRTKEFTQFRSNVDLTTGRPFAPAGRQQPTTGGIGVRGQGGMGGKPGAPGAVMPPGGAKTPPGGAGGLGGAGGGGGGGLTEMPAPQSPAEIDAYVKSHFGADAWFMDVPEIKSILTDMAKNRPAGLSAAGEAEYAKEAARRVSATDWYQNHDAKSRLWYQNEHSDPGTARDAVRDQTRIFDKMAKKMGITIAPDRLSAIAESSLRFDWTNEDIQSALGAEFHFDPTNKAQGATVSALKQKAGQYLVPLSDQAIQQWGQGLLAGTSTDADFEQYLKDSAKSMFPQLAAAIDAGTTVAQYADPYKQLAAKALDLPPDAIDFNDSKWRPALDQFDAKTGQKTVMTLTDWERKIKSDPAYGYDRTNAGIGEASSLANDILKKFGVTA